MAEWLQSLNISDVIAWVSAALGTYAAWFVRNAQTALDTVKTESEKAVTDLTTTLAQVQKDLDDLKSSVDKSNTK